MKAFFITADDKVDLTKIDWDNTICLSRDVEAVRQSRDDFNPRGMVVEIEMDDDDVVEAVLACMHGNSCKVRAKIIRVVYSPLPAGTLPKYTGVTV